MSLHQLANVGEFIGGIGVLVTLLFVAVQIRQNTRAIRNSDLRAAGNSLIATMNANNSVELAEVSVRGYNDLSSLTEAERFWFDQGLFAWMHAHEQEHLASRDTAILDELLAPRHRAIAAVLSTPGGACWWSERRAWFTDYFVDVVDELLASPPEGAEVTSFLGDSITPRS